MANNNNCDGKISVDFLSYVVVNSTMNIIDVNDDLTKIPVYIAVNAENLNSYVKEEPYCPIGGVPVPDPCNSGTFITVPCVTLNEARVSGPINYIVGIGVVDTTGRATDSIEPGVRVIIEAGQLGTIASAYDSVFIDNEVLLYLDSLNDPAPNLKVTVTDLKVLNDLDNIEGDHCFQVTGTFVIEEDTL